MMLETYEGSGTMDDSASQSLNAMYILKKEQNSAKKLQNDNRRTEIEKKLLQANQKIN